MSRLSRQIIQCKYFFQHRSVPAPTIEPIDVVIPIIEKDLQILPLCLEGIRHCVQHSIKDIFIVAPKNENIIAFCQQHHLTYIDESIVLGITPKDVAVKFISPDNKTVIDRSGWLFQQFLKLSANIGSCENYLCIDADHILIRPHVFLSDKGIPIFYTSTEHHRPYYKMIHQLLGDIKLTPLSYVAHKMLFNKNEVAALKTAITAHTRESWMNAIIKHYDAHTISGFSEFETYGNFVKHKILLPWQQHALAYQKIAGYQELAKRYRHRYRAITFPHHHNS